MRCRKASCSVKPSAVNVNPMQKPVNTEHSVTSRPVGRRLLPLSFLRRPKKRTRAGTFGSRTSEPSPASTRCLSFHSIRDRNVAWYRCPSRSKRVRQKRNVSCWRAWQNASSVMQASFRPEQVTRTKPQASRRPCVFDCVVRPTYIMSQTTTSGISGRLRPGAHPHWRATSANSSAGSMRRKGVRPKCCRMCEARERPGPIEDMRKPPCTSRALAVLLTALLTTRSALGGFFVERGLT